MGGEGGGGCKRGVGRRAGVEEESGRGGKRVYKENIKQVIPRIWFSTFGQEKNMCGVVCLFGVCVCVLLRGYPGHYKKNRTFHQGNRRNHYFCIHYFSIEPSNMEQ